MNEENLRWGSGRRLEIVRRYQAVLGISHLVTEYHKDYLDYLRKGFFEPIPLAWSTSNYNPLTSPVLFSNFEDGAGTSTTAVLRISSSLRMCRGASLLGAQQLVSAWQAAPAENAPV